MFVKYNPKHKHVKVIPVIENSTGDKAIPLASDSVILRPGTNELTEQEWAAIQPHVKDEIEKKIIVPFTVPVKRAGGIIQAKTLKDVPASVARKIIESCQNVTDLKKWARQELPDEIMLLVLKRLRKFKIDPDEFADDLPGEEDTLDKDITPESGTVTEPGTETKTDSEDTEDDDLDEDADSPGTESGGNDTDEEEDDENEIPDFDGSRNQE